MNICNHRPTYGFTLIELMIAISIAAIIGLIVTTTFQAALIGGMRADATAEQNDQARIALTLMTRDITSAGFLMGLSATNGSACSSIVGYNSATSANNGSTQLFPVQATDETGSNPLPNTSTPTVITPTFPAQSKPAQAITVTFNNASGNSASIGSASARVLDVQKNSGKLQAASLFVDSASQLHDNDVSLLYVPGIKSCIRFQITHIQTNQGGGGGSVGDLVLHNSGQSTLNPSGGFDYYNGAPFNLGITQNLLTKAYLLDAGTPGTADGLTTVAYSLRDLNGTPTLFRTVTSFDGKVLQDYAVANDVAFMRFAFAPIKADGTLDAFVPWATIVTNNQQSSVGAVQVALLMQRKNYGNRGGTPATISVLDATYTTEPKTEYQLVTKTIYLTNMGLDR